MQSYSWPAAHSEGPKPQEARSAQSQPVCSGEAQLTQAPQPPWQTPLALLAFLLSSDGAGGSAAEADAIKAVSIVTKVRLARATPG